MDKIIVLCSCVGGDDHHLMIVRDLECPTEFYISIQPSNADSIWEKIKYAWRYVWNGPHYDTIVVEQEEIKELGRTLLNLKTIKPKERTVDK
jgi:hypothetical protein